MSQQVEGEQQQMTPEQKMEIFKRIGEEIQDEKDLLQLLQKKQNFVVYDGFEPSGRIHIAQGLMKAINTNRMIKCGAHCIFYVADWFALLNNKCNGNLEHIRKLGQYFIEVWRASGMNLDGVEFIWSNDLIAKSDTYWKRVFDIAQNTTMQRVERCCTAMGRQEGASLSVGQILYPVMQASDVFELKCDICQLGIDQRKVNMLAREYAQKKKITKPVIVSHHMLLGLIGGKMSKSIQGSAIFMDDAPEDVEAKIMNAECKEAEEGNPVLEYYKYLVYGAQEVKLNNMEIVVKINDKIYENYQQLAEAYLKQQITPEQLKVELARIINMLLQPIRDAFQQNQQLKEIQDFAIKFRTSR